MTFVVSAGTSLLLEERDRAGEGSEDAPAADRLIVTLGRIACRKEVRYRMLWTD